MIRYSDGRFELWETEIGLILSLGLGIDPDFTNISNGRLFIRYTDGRTYLLDLDWLHAMGGRANSMTIEELVEILCNGPLSLGWVNENTLVDEKNTLGEYLGSEPQACKP